MSLAIIIEIVLSALVAIGIPAMLGWAIWSSHADARASVPGLPVRILPLRGSPIRVPATRPRRRGAERALRSAGVAR